MKTGYVVSLDSEISRLVLVRFENDVEFIEWFDKNKEVIEMLYQGKVREVREVQTERKLYTFVNADDYRIAFNDGKKFKKH